MTVRWSMDDQDRRDILDDLHKIHNEIDYTKNLDWWYLLSDIIVKVTLYMQPIPNVLPDEDGDLCPLSAGDSK